MLKKGQNRGNWGILGIQKRRAETGYFGHKLGGQKLGIFGQKLGIFLEYFTEQNTIFFRWIFAVDIISQR